MGIDLNAGDGPEPSPDPRPWGRMRLLFEAVDELLDPEDGNPAAREARRALLDRGESEEAARYRIGRLYLGIVWYFSERPEEVAEAGGPGPFVEEACNRLRDGEPPSAIFPEVDALAEVEENEPEGEADPDEGDPPEGPPRDGGP